VENFAKLLPGTERLGIKEVKEELRVLGGYHIKNLLLDKFRRLPFEQKKAKKDELNNLIEKDAYELGYG
ncbi:6202_t:CDS:2, partial [Funneliformis geosporum]